MRVVYQRVSRLALVVTVLALAGCGSSASYVDLPPFRGYAVNDALRRLHALGLRAAYPAWKMPCGDGLPVALMRSHAGPSRVRRGSTVKLKFQYGEIPSPTAPDHHARWTRVPELLGRDFAAAEDDLVAIWPCVHVQPAQGTSGTRMVIVAQKPRAGMRVPAYGVRVGHHYRPTTVDLTVAAR
jgi:hypothetical protein